MSDFSHLDAAGNPRMVDVSAKAVTRRLARARAIVVLPPEVLAQFDGDDIRTKKGGVFQTAIIAGIMAAKRTSELIPLCHPLGLDQCDVQIRLNALREVEIECTASITAKTGVEMEALTGASVAALTVYDMCKALSQQIVVREVRLLEKTGGKQAMLSQELSPAPLYGLVLAGGRSQRMGQDKGLLDWHGRPQREYLAGLLQGLGVHAFISCRPEQVGEFPATQPLVPDTFLDLGPLGAVLSAFRQHPEAAWLVVACDMPLLDAATLQFLIENRRPELAATAFRAPAFADGLSPDPLAAIWEPRIYPALLQRLGEGRTCARKALLRSEIHLLTPPDPAALSNVNTPEELAGLRNSGRL